MQFRLKPELVFNYLGQFDRTGTGNDLFELSDISTGSEVGPKIEKPHKLEINGMVIGDKLEISFNYNKHQYEPETIQRLANRYKEHLSQMIRHCLSKQVKEITPTDYQYNKLTQRQLDTISKRLKKKL
ncbi:Gramicidin S synthase 1 [compost metagenome]